MKDYLIDLLTNHNRYEAKIGVLKNHQHLFHDQDEFEHFMCLEQDIACLKYCIGQLAPTHKEVIDYLYFKGFSLKQLGTAMRLCKTAVYNRKERAIRELRWLFGEKLEKK
jgi:DNA-directed RNA polymerase specialized sigma24 family protein